MGVDLLIRDARWLQPDGSFAMGHLLARGGRIRHLRLDDSLPQGVPAIEARGLLVLPGAIDAHTHFRQPGQAYKEGIRNGTRAALKGGVTTVLDMPNTVPPCTSTARLRRKRDLFATHSLVNWGLHVLALPGKAPPELPYAFGKIYMAQSSRAPAVAPRALGRVLAGWPRVMVHAEDETAFPPLAPTAPHHQRRPRAAITRALEAMSAALDAGGTNAQSRIVVCHVSTADEVAWIRDRKARGFDVWGETCPHYCLLTHNDYLRHGSRLQVNPPLRDERDRRAILEGVASGDIDFISSDHAPHTPREKASSHPPSGIPGIEWLVPAMLHLVSQGVISWKRLHEVMCASQSACFCVRHRDGLLPGNVADMVVVSPSAGSPVVPIVTRAHYDPFDGVPLGWTVHATIVNGSIMYRDGVVAGSARGREVVS
ncbi:dihydroorotase family protein [Candidatus Fermentibacteria bacterium]|nr:dihydroorotase family protein [Candidatus Fermentibacteria bacterium]